MADFPAFASATTSPLRLVVADVSWRPPFTVPVLYSELSNPVLRVAKANTEATATKAIRTIAVSRPVVPRCSLEILETSCNSPVTLLLLVSLIAANPSRGSTWKRAIA